MKPMSFSQQPVSRFAGNRKRFTHTSRAAQFGGLRTAGIKIKINPG
jgi:hypothetical protein